MGIADIAILALIIASAVLGLFRGLVKELIMLVMLIVALLAAYYGADLISQGIPDKTWEFGGQTMAVSTVGWIVSFIVILLVVLVVRKNLANVASRVPDATGLGIIDRILGSTFGMTRGALIVALIIMTASMNIFSLSSSTWWQQSRTIPMFEQWIDLGIDKIAPQYKDYFYLPSVGQKVLES